MRTYDDRYLEAELHLIFILAGKVELIFAGCFDLHHLSENAGFMDCGLGGENRSLRILGSHIPGNSMPGFRSEAAILVPPLGSLGEQPYSSPGGFSVAQHKYRSDNKI